jgi:C_GCAxxG_C_C family probable redox protein
MSQKQYTLQEASHLDPDEKEAYLQRIEADGRETEELNWGCSQVVMDTLQRNLKFGNQEVFMASTGFAGGIAGFRETCGALIGAIMAIGVVYGRKEFKDGKVAHEDVGFMETRARANKLCDKFTKRFGSLRCADVRQAVGRIPLGDEDYLYTLEGVKNHSKCGDVTGFTARTTAEIMMEPSEAFPLDIEARSQDLNRVRKQLEEGSGE